MISMLTPEEQELLRRVARRRAMVEAPVGSRRETLNHGHVRTSQNKARAVLTANSSAAASSPDALLQLELSKELARLQAEVRMAMPENPAACGFKVYSQADEDGIVDELTRRLGIERGHFIEIGCGDERENNSHYLLLKGWRGIWVDGDPDNIAAVRAALPLDGRLRLVEQMVTRDNVAAIPRPRDHRTSASWTCSQWMSTAMILRLQKQLSRRGRQRSSSANTTPSFRIQCSRKCATTRCINGSVMTTTAHPSLRGLSG